MYIPSVPKPERQFKVGDRVTVSLHTGRLVEAVVKAIVHKTDGTRLQVDYEQDQTALVHLWQVHGCMRLIEGPRLHASFLQTKIPASWHSALAGI